MKVAVTGGAGFVGTHMVPLLATHGHDVTVFDNLSPQVHNAQTFPAEVRDHATCIRADIRDLTTLREVLKETEIVVHLAAETGTGQSMYDIYHYSEVNVLGTAAILDIVMNQPNRIRRFILASSRAVYGEGQYHCPRCGTVYPPMRTVDRLIRHAWEPPCPHCDGPIAPVPTQEVALLQPQSVYASGKQTQEQLVTIACRAREIETVILRYHNIYGPGQSLSNPYTGVINTFFTQFLIGKPVLLFEDGLPSRDFVFIDDVAEATCAAIEGDEPIIGPVNVGTGKRTTICDVAVAIAKALGVEARTGVAAKHRSGDIRHCYADIARMTDQLKCTPRVDFAEGIRRFVAWAQMQDAITGQIAGQFERAQGELVARNLFK